VLSSPTKEIHSLLVCDVVTGKTLREKSIELPGSFSKPYTGYNPHENSYQAVVDVESGLSGIYQFDINNFNPQKKNVTVGQYHFVSGLVFNPTNGLGYGFAYALSTGPSGIALCQFDITAGTISAIVPFPNENNIRSNPLYDHERGIIYALAFVNNLQRAILRFDLSVRTFQATNIQMVRAAYMDAVAIAPPRGPYAGKTIGVLQFPNSAGATIVQFVWIDPISGALHNATNPVPGSPIPIETFFSHEGMPYTLFSNSTASASYVGVVPSQRPPSSIGDEILPPIPNAPEFTYIRTFDPPLALYPNTARLLKR